MGESTNDNQGPAFYTTHNQINDDRACDEAISVIEASASALRAGDYEAAERHLKTLPDLLDTTFDVLPGSEGSVEFGVPLANAREACKTAAEHLDRAAAFLAEGRTGYALRRLDWAYDEIEGAFEDPDEHW